MIINNQIELKQALSCRLLWKTTRIQGAHTHISNPTYQSPDWHTKNCQTLCSVHPRHGLKLLTIMIKTFLRNQHFNNKEANSNPVSLGVCPNIPVSDDSPNCSSSSDTRLKHKQQINLTVVYVIVRNLGNDESCLLDTHVISINKHIR